MKNKLCDNSCCMYIGHMVQMMNLRMICYNSLHMSYNLYIHKEVLVYHYMIGYMIVQIDKLIDMNHKSFQIDKMIHMIHKKCCNPNKMNNKQIDKCCILHSGHMSYNANLLVE